MEIFSVCICLFYLFSQGVHLGLALKEKKRRKIYSHYDKQAFTKKAFWPLSCVKWMWLLHI